MSSPSVPPSADVLDSWKEIAAYLRRDVRTVIRWEQSRGLPVHRLPGGRKAAVYALRSELDQWRRGGAAMERAEVVAAPEPAQGSGGAGGKIAWPAPTLAPAKPAIAVLPFVNLSSDQENGYFADGLADEVITLLAGTHGLRVTARTSSFAFRDKARDVREIGQRLGVETLLEGSVQRAGEQIRVSAQLVSCKDGCHLWCERYDRELSEVFAVQEEIARSIACALHLRLEPPARSGRTRNLEAYQLWLKGRHLRFSWRSMEDMQTSGQMFAQAVALDDEFAAAHLAVGQHLMQLAILGFIDPRELSGRGRAEIERALALDDRLGEAHAVNGILQALFDFDWAGAEQSFQKALAREPGSAVIRRSHAHGLLAPLRRLEEAEAEAALALELDPFSPESHFILAMMLFFRRDYARAEASIQTSLELGTANPFTLWISGMIAACQGKYDAAVSRCEKAVELFGGAPLAATQMGMLYGMVGRVEEARRILEQIEQAARTGAYVSPIYSAVVQMGLGDLDGALGSLDRAIEVRDPHILHLPVKPIYDRLRGDPRFAELLRKMRLPVY